MIAFSVVDLPAPLRPIRQSTSPGADGEARAAEHLHRAVAGVEVGDGRGVMAPR